MAIGSNPRRSKTPKLWAAIIEPPNRDREGAINRVLYLLGRFLTGAVR